MKKFLLLFFAVATQLFFAQIEKHVKLNYDIKSTGDNLYEAIITAKIDKDRKSTRLNSSHLKLARMPSSA